MQNCADQSKITVESQSLGTYLTRGLAISFLCSAHNSKDTVLCSILELRVSYALEKTKPLSYCTFIYFTNMLKFKCYSGGHLHANPFSEELATISLLWIIIAAMLSQRHPIFLYPNRNHLDARYSGYRPKHITSDFDAEKSIIFIQL